MPSEKSTLLERINNAINKKWRHRSLDIFSPHLDSKTSCESGESTCKDYFSQSQNAASIERIEQRIEALERQNNQLLHFIDFLVENLPDLVIDILCADKERQNLFSHHGRAELAFPNSLATSCLLDKNQPCPTRRELDVLKLLVEGFCAKEIANRLFISETTVITHKKNLKEKFNAKNTAELISKAQAHLSHKDRK